MVWKAEKKEIIEESGGGYKGILVRERGKGGVFRI